MKLMAKPISRQELIDTMNENMTVERTKDDGTKHIVSSEQYLNESIAHIQSLGYFVQINTQIYIITNNIENYIIWNYKKSN